MTGNNSDSKRELLPPPVGTSDWVTFSRDSYCVDKTLILKDLIDSKTRVVLFTRPRRFGKTTMMEMIRAFYEKVEKDGRTVDTSTLFSDKKIWAAGEKYRAEHGKRPVKSSESGDKPDPTRRPSCPDARESFQSRRCAIRQSGGLSCVARRTLR